MNISTSETFVVALVDDDAVYRQLTSMTIAKHRNFIIHEAASGEELHQLLAQHRIDCIVLDFNLGLETGFAVKEKLAKHYATLPPIVMLTGDGSERTVIKALRLGIDDYVAKRNLDSGELVSAIVRAIGLDRQERSLRTDHHRLTQASGLDTITCLFGREHLDDLVARLAALPPAARATYALVFVEMTEFAEINETFGLAAGTQALRAFAERLRGLGRSQDVCGRYVDGTFLYIIETKGDPSLLEAFCIRLAGGLRFRIDLDAASLQMSARVGGALCQSAGNPTEEIIGRAQQALRDAKAGAVAFSVLDADVATNAPPAPTESTAPAALPAAALPAADRLRGSNRRQEPRQRVLRRGHIILLDLDSTLDCTVRNMSSRGAGLRVGASFAVPEEFDLVVDGLGERRRVRVQWQVGQDLGVEYIA